MNRPDSNGQPCTEWTPGRPGDGVMVFPLGPEWQPPFAHRIDDYGRPVEHFLSGGGLFRITAREDVPAVRGRAVMGGCMGDGHYECARCVFYRPPWGEQARTIDDWRECR